MLSRFWQQAQWHARLRPSRKAAQRNRPKLSQVASYDKNLIGSLAPFDTVEGGAIALPRLLPVNERDLVAEVDVTLRATTQVLAAHWAHCPPLCLWAQGSLGSFPPTPTSARILEGNPDLAGFDVIASVASSGGLVWALGAVASALFAGPVFGVAH